MTERTAGPGQRPPISGGAPTGPPRQFLPLTEELERLWDEVAAAPRFGGSRWRYLALRRHLRLRLIAPEQVRIVGPPGKINDCTACTDICCVGPRSAVLLRFKDITTLIDIGRPDLISQQKPRFSPADLAKRPALRRHVGSASWQVFPVLKQDSMGACAALTREGRCGVYPNWPLSCARFPYALHTDMRDVFFSRRCDSFWVRPDAGLPVGEMACAAVTAYNERIKDLVLLEYAPERLAALGLTAYLDMPSTS